MTSATLKLDRSGSKRAHFNPLFQSMITGMINGAVDGLVALEIGLKDDDKSAQLNDVAVLGHAEGCSERRRTGSLSPFSACSDLAAKIGRSS